MLDDSSALGGLGNMVGKQELVNLEEFNVEETKWDRKIVNILSMSTNWDSCQPQLQCSSIRELCCGDGGRRIVFSSS